MPNIEDLSLHVFITHYVPDESNFYQKISDFLVPRMSFAYLRSWARLLKHGTRGNQPWKRDVMTKPRKRANVFAEENLAQVCRQLELFPCKEIIINLYSNKEFSFAVSGTRTKIKLNVFYDLRRMNSLNNSPWIESDESSPWSLLWKHKEDLKKLNAENSQNDRIFIVLENDTLFTESNLRNWLTNRSALRELNLIPSFVKVEFSKQNMDWRCVNIFDKYTLSKSNCRTLVVEQRRYLQVSGLYTGIIVLDDELLREYVESDAFSKSKSRNLIWWDLGARASMGLQFWNVPKGFQDRYVYEIDFDNFSLKPSSIVHHLPNLYVGVHEVSSKMPSLSDLTSFTKTISG